MVLLNAVTLSVAFSRLMYMQGGLTYAHGRIALSEALNRMMKTGALKVPQS